MLASDVFFEHGEDAAGPFGEALERAKAYAAAGASGFFVPGLVDDTLIGRIVEGTPLPGQRHGHGRRAVE